MIRKLLLNKSLTFKVNSQAMSRKKSMFSMKWRMKNRVQVMFLKNSKRKGFVEHGKGLTEELKHKQSKPM